ncbi:MAG: Xaa-Pro peptidase family protein [Dysgonamonadaceae bacterium]|jgi:Xaa-Pro aminopeptidase|nr:Xaa-Pro peptidase family protein [Dysgonamonadaceae bacterium]
MTTFLSNKELQTRWERLQTKMSEIGADTCIIVSNVNLYYLSGRIFTGYFYLPAEGEPVLFVRKPLGWNNDNVVYIRKPEDISSWLQTKGISIPKHILLEADQLTYNDYVRLQAVFNPEKTSNATTLLRQVRSIKTDWEIGQFRISAKKHAEVYSRIKGCYSPGMSDAEFQAKIEYVMRSMGSIGIFRAFGNNMDIHMGSVLAGENAEVPAPFDFALGGEGIDSSLPIGSNGAIMKPRTSVMIDMVGNYTAYLSDMTRTFSIGKLPDIAYRAHQLSIDIQDAIAEKSKPGTSCAELYILSLQMAEKAGFSNYFMGTKQQAKFVGHGVGLEINELPVLTERSKELLVPGNVFALEPKFVLPSIGAVGIENTFLVTDSGVEKITLFEEQIIDLEENSPSDF